MRKSRIALLFVVGLATVVAGVALATPPSDLQSQLLARGAVGDQYRPHAAGGVAASQLGAVDVAVVRATLGPGGTTGWHSHPEGSMVILRSGMLADTEALEGSGRIPFGGTRCVARTYDASTGGKAFFHTSGPHVFSNPGTTPAEFYVAYFAPRGAGLLIDVPVAPAPCA